MKKTCPYGQMTAAITSIIVKHVIGRYGSCDETVASGNETVFSNDTGQVESVFFYYRTRDFSPIMVFLIPPIHFITLQPYHFSPLPMLTMSCHSRDSPIKSDSKTRSHK